MANAEDEVGIVRGLAWTSVGGDTLQIEVNVMPGKGEIILTGQLGDVIVLAGKGHETEQEIGTQRVHLDEREEIASFFQQNTL